MIFAIIEPKERRVRNFDCKDYKDATREAGLKIGELDFGTVARWKDGASLSIIVYEYGLIKPQGDWFAFEGQLYNGNAVIFKADAEGETVDLPLGLAEHLTSDCTHLIWLESAEEAERAIESGEVNRPQTSINGKVIWQWSPKP